MNLISNLYKNAFIDLGFLIKGKIGLWNTDVPSMLVNEIPNEPFKPERGIRQEILYLLIFW